jgi:polyhydroxyalkanoate synthesis regulator phasin
MNKKLVAGLAAAGVLAGGGTAAALVAAGGTTPAAASTMTAVSTTATVPAGPLASLVARGTITQSQATAIHNALIAYLQEHRQNIGEHRAYCTDSTPRMLASGGPLKTVLGQLVKNGTITQSQANAVINAFTQQFTARWGDGPGWHGNGPGMMGGARMGWAD